MPRTAAKLASKKRLHKGDIMSPETRSALMSRIRGRDTKPEKAVALMLDELGVRYECHAADLPGRPDYVLNKERICIFVDGDFWHGWRFSSWRLKLSVKWDTKIESNIARDRRNHRKLRRMGWRVIRIWEHQIVCDAEKCKQRIQKAIEEALA